MQALLRLGKDKNLDVPKRAREMFGVANLLNLNMTQYDMLKRNIERS